MFSKEADTLRDRLRADINKDLHDTIPALRATVFDGAKDDTLRSARYVRKHAPSHPNPHPRWYSELPLVQRLHTIYDRVRGFPWPESKPFMDEQLADKYNQEG
ncbi:MAG: hypothetical protein ACR2MN_14720 [Acidimicrobiales bacterium]